MVGLLLGGALGSALGFGFGGGWERLYLLGLPVRHGPGMWLGLLLGGVLGATLGLATAFPRSRWPGGLLGTLLGGLGAGVLFGLLGEFPPREWPSLYVFGLALAGFVRLLVETVVWAARRGRWAEILAGGVALLLVVLLGLGLTFLVFLLQEGVDRGCASLRAAHQYALSQGWEEHTLELVWADDGNARVRFHLPGGETRDCRVSLGEVICPY
ncbi:MAG: hypothetical protein DRI79_13235 [Chloroflexi bacterium]|nr:MAG: hypothetical protein DRI79_13235 [Chloroflexota bacterium]